MRIVVDGSVFESEPAWCLPLFWFARVHRHRVLVGSSAQPAFRKWREALAPESHAAAVDHAVEWSMLEEASNRAYFGVTVSTEPTGGRAISPIAAWNLLQRPYRLLLEDGVNDREFLLRMCPKPERDFLRERMAKEWLEPDHGGGISSMPRRVEELFLRGEPLLASCLFDSDAGAPASPSKASRKLEEVCRDAGMHRHQLARRAIENYLPRSVLEGWAGMGQNRTIRRQRRASVQALYTLSVTQRHHENLKEALGDAKVGHLFGDDTAMNDADLQREGGPAELLPFVRELVERVR